MRTAATRKATSLVRAGIARTRLTTPYEPLVVETVPRTLVIGGGIAGLRAAVGLADIGLGVVIVEREVSLGGWVRRFGAIYPHDRDGRELIAGLVRGRQGATDHHRPDRRGGRRQVRQLRRLPGGDPGRRRGGRDDPRAGRLDHRGHRLRQLPARCRRVRLRHRRRAHAAPVQGAGRRLDRRAALARPAGAQRRLRLLRGQPPAGRQRVLLALLLHGHVPHRGLRGGPRSGHPPVPPVPRHPDLRQVRDAVHGGPQDRLGVPEVPRGDATGGRRATRRRPRGDRHGPADGAPGARAAGGPRGAGHGHGPARQRGAGRRAQAAAGQGRVLQRDPSQAAAGRDRRGRRPDRRRLPGTQDLRRRASPPASPR